MSNTHLLTLYHLIQPRYYRNRFFSCVCKIIKYHSPFLHYFHGNQQEEYRMSSYLPFCLDSCFWGAVLIGSNSGFCLSSNSIVGATDDKFFLPVVKLHLLSYSRTNIRTKGQSTQASRGWIKLFQVLT